MHRNTEEVEVGLMHAAAAAAEAAAAGLILGKRVPEREEMGGREAEARPRRRFSARTPARASKKSICDARPTDGRTDGRVVQPDVLMS